MGAVFLVSSKKVDQPSLEWNLFFIRFKPSGWGRGGGGLPSAQFRSPSSLFINFLNPSMS